MKIAFLTPEFPHPKIGSSGGIGTSILNLCYGLLKFGHEVVVLVYGQNQDEVFTDKGITFYRIKNVKLKGLSRFLTQKKIEKLINTLYRENKIEVIEAPDWTGMTSFIRSNCPLVVKLHGSDTYFCHLDQRPVKFLNRFHEKRALQKADALLSVSSYTAEVTSELFALKRYFTVIPNGIDTDLFVRQKEEAVQENILLYFGTLIRKKGLLELPLIFNEVYKQNINTKLILIGKDAADKISGNASTWQMMKPLFDKETLQNVNYLGSIPYQEIKEYISRATICIFPTFAEALPVSWIEAMAMQKAIVASDIGWASEVIDDEINGCLVAPKEHKRYADKILELLGDEEVRNRFGTEARKKVITNFSMEVIAKKSIDFYSNCLKNK